MKKYYTYVRIFGATGPPHLLPKYVPDKLLVREIAYQTIEKGATCLFIREKQKVLAHFSSSHRHVFSAE
jgi:hypothetical protein